MIFLLLLALVALSSLTDRKTSPRKYTKTGNHPRIDISAQNEIQTPPLPVKLDEAKAPSSSIPDPPNYQSLGVTDDDVEYIANDSLIEDVFRTAEETEFNKETLVSEKHSFYEECPIEVKGSACTVVHAEYENSDGSKTKFVTLNGKSYVKKVFYPDNSKVVLAFNLESGGYEDIIVGSGTENQLHSISFDSQGRVRYRTDQYKGLIFNLEYNQEEQLETGTIGKTFHDNSYTEVKFPKVF